jgi:hypothetical protein
MAWTEQQVDSNHRKDRAAKADYYGTTKLTDVVRSIPEAPQLVKKSKTFSSLIQLYFVSARRFWSNLRKKHKG